MLDIAEVLLAESAFRLKVGRTERDLTASFGALLGENNKSTVASNGAGDGGQGVPRKNESSECVTKKRLPASLVYSAPSSIHALQDTEMTSRFCRAALAIISSTTLVACVQTSLSAIKSPELGTRQFSSVVVFVKLRDLDLRRQAEDAFADLSTKRTHFVQSYTLFFPGQTYSDEQMAEILAAKNLDATLVVSLDKAGTETTQTPADETSTCTSEVNGVCEQVSTTGSGGYEINKPWASYSIRLADAKTGQVVWVASTNSGGNAYSSQRDLLQSVAQNAVQKLTADSVIR